MKSMLLDGAPASRSSFLRHVCNDFRISLDFSLFQSHLFLYLASFVVFGFRVTDFTFSSYVRITKFLLSF